MRHEVLAPGTGEPERVSIRHWGVIERGVVYKELMEGIIEGWITNELDEPMWDPHSLLGIFSDGDFDKFSDEIMEAKAKAAAPMLISGSELFPVELALEKESKDLTWRLFLDPSVGWLPRRVERLVNGIVQKAYENSDFREVAPGVWFPFKLVYRGAPSGDDELTRCTFTVESMKLLESQLTNSEFELQFPNGTLVHDRVLGMAYRVLADGGVEMLPLYDPTTGETIGVSSVSTDEVIRDLGSKPSIDSAANKLETNDPGRANTRLQPVSTAVPVTAGSSNQSGWVLAVVCVAIAVIGIVLVRLFKRQKASS